MNTYTLKIDKHLNIQSILKCFSDIENINLYHYTLQYLYGIAEFDESYLENENDINNSEYGKKFTFNELILFFKNMTQIFEFLLIINPIEKELKMKYNNDLDIYDNNYLVIEYFDAGYYEVNSKSSEIIEIMKGKFCIQ